MIFGIISSLLFLAVGIPFFIITTIIIVVMVKFDRKLIFIRRLARSRYNSFIKKLILHRQDYLTFGKDQHIF